MAERRGWQRRPARYVAAGVCLATVMALAGFVAASGAPEPDVPKTTPHRLVASVAEALVARRPLSGWVVTYLDLGLPAIPQAPSGEGALSFAGDHRLRVWQSPVGLRVTDVLPLGERALIVGPNGAWTWDSESFSARRLAGPAVTSAMEDLGGLLNLLDPVALARTALRQVSSSTKVDLAPPARVAGRDAYVLVLRPRSEATLVDRVAVSIDERTRLPLAVEVFGDGRARPSISARFESVSYEPVPRALFEFSPPPEATIRRSSHHYGPGEGPPGRDRAFWPEDARVFGAGWASVLAIPLPDASSAAELGRQDPTGLPSPEALTPFSGPLFSADIVEVSSRRWLLVGAVPLERLERAGSRI
jgi:hypothetical protein